MDARFPLSIRLIFFMLLLLPGFLFAQEEAYPKQMGIGFKGGLSYSTVAIDLPLQQINPGIDPSFGLIFSYVDKKTVGIQLELNYLTKSWEEIPDANQSFRVQLNYLEIPLLTTLHFGKRLKFIVNFGPYLNLLLHEQSQSNLDNNSDFYPYYSNRTPSGADFGLIGGGGLRLKTKLGLFQVEARYSYGFQNIYDITKSGLNFSNLSQINLSLSYQFLIFNEK